MTRSVMGVCLLAVLAGCGYTSQSALPSQYQSIAIKPFVDQSREYGLQAPLTNAVTRKFIHDGRLRVTGEENADLLLEGAILNYQLKGLTFDQDDNVTQFLVLVVAAARLSDTASGEVVWQEEIMSGETTYYTRASGQSADRLRGNAEVFLPTVRSFASEEENRAASEALEQLASDIFYLTVEPF